MNLDCTTNSYDRLYLPWLENPGKLLDLAGYKQGDTLLDLAGGTGIISREAARRCNNVGCIGSISLLDPNPRVPDGPYLHKWINETQGYAESVETYYPASKFDVVVCRQAIGYINMVYAIPGIHQVLKPGGRFVFNSFGKPSLFGFKFKNHTVWPESSGDQVIEANRTNCAPDHFRFVEFHVRLFGDVFHIQFRLSSPMGFDCTLFKYNSVDFLMELLKPWFKVEMIQKGNSVQWLCTKESE